MKKLISVVVPMYFEEKVVDECYKRLTEVMGSFENYNYEIIFVNDGSTDQTLPKLKDFVEHDKHIRIIDFARNFGHQIAVTAGIKEAKGDAVVVIDADLQDPPELIKDMVENWENGYDVVYAKRRKREGETLFKLITAKGFYKFLDFMSDVKIPRDTGDYRLMDRQVVDVFNTMSEKNRFVRGMVSWLGFNQTFVEFDRAERFAGESKYPLKKMIKLAEDGIISFSHKPISLITGLSVVFFLVFGIQLISIIVEAILGHIPSTLIITTYMSLIAAIILGSIAVIGKYIIRMFDEVNKRPLYIVKDKYNF